MLSRKTEIYDGGTRPRCHFSLSAARPGRVNLIGPRANSVRRVSPGAATEMPRSAVARPDVISVLRVPAQARSDRRHSRARDRRRLRRHAIASRVAADPVGRGLKVFHRARPQRAALTSIFKQSNPLSPLVTARALRSRTPHAHTLREARRILYTVSQNHRLPL